MGNLLPHEIPAQVPQPLTDVSRTKQVARLPVAEDLARVRGKARNVVQGPFVGGDRPPIEIILEMKTGPFPTIKDIRAELGLLPLAGEIRTKGPQKGNHGVKFPPPKEQHGRRPVFAPLARPKGLEASRAQPVLLTLRQAVQFSPE